MGWAAEGQETERRTGCLDCAADGRPFVGGQVVEDHDVALPQRWAKGLLDIREEPGLGHGPVEHQGGSHAGQPERSREGRGLPVAVRHAGSEALTARGATAKPGHLGAGAGLVDEHQPLRIEVELALEPGLPPR